MSGLKFKDYYPIPLFRFPTMCNQPFQQLILFYITSFFCRHYFKLSRHFKTGKHLLLQYGVLTNTDFNKCITLSLTRQMDACRLTTDYYYLLCFLKPRAGMKVKVCTCAVRYLNKFSEKCVYMIYILLVFGI